MGNEKPIGHSEMEIPVRSRLESFQDGPWKRWYPPFKHLGGQEVLGVKASRMNPDEPIWAFGKAMKEAVA
jgi:hypothetical protein